MKHQREAHHSGIVCGFRNDPIYFGVTELWVSNHFHILLTFNLRLFGIFKTKA